MGGMFGPDPMGGMFGPDPMGGMFGPDPMGGMFGPDPMGGMFGPDPLGDEFGPDPIAGPAPVGGGTGSGSTIVSDAVSQTGTGASDIITARFTGDVLTGAGGGDDLSSGSFFAIFNYGSTTLNALQGETYQDEINGGWFNSSLDYNTGANIGLKIGDSLKFNVASLSYNDVAFSTSASNIVISASGNGSFAGTAAAGAFGIFDAANIDYSAEVASGLMTGAQATSLATALAGNKVAAIDMDGSGDLGMNDLYWDLADNVGKASYDNTLDVITFA